MAGAGYKLFNTGDVLTAAQVNTYLQEQTVMVFASSAARTTALSGVLAEGMMSYLQDTNAVEVYNGSAWTSVGGGGGDLTEIQAGVGISVASGTGPIPIITNSSTDLITTAGDILYGTAADTVARLGIGTAGQFLKVNSGGTAPEWGAASSGLTKVTSSSFSAAATASVNNCFSATYDYYRLIIEAKPSVASQDLKIRWRVSGADATGSNYDYQYVYSVTTTVAGAGVNNTTSASIAYLGSTAQNCYVAIDVYNPNKAINTAHSGTSMSYEGDASTNLIGGNHQLDTAYDGFTLFPATSGNITGKVTVYGYQI